MNETFNFTKAKENNLISDFEISYISANAEFIIVRSNFKLKNFNIISTFFLILLINIDNYNAIN